MISFRTAFISFSTRVYRLWSKLQYGILALFALGMLDAFAYYDTIAVVFGAAAPEIAPILALAAIYLIYRGYRKSRRLRREAQAVAELEAKEENERS